MYIYPREGSSTTLLALYLQTMRAQAPRKKFPILILEEYGESDQMHMERVVWAGLGGRDGRRQGYDRVIVLVLVGGFDPNFIHRAANVTSIH